MSTNLLPLFCVTANIRLGEFPQQDAIDRQMGALHSQVPVVSSTNEAAFEVDVYKLCGGDSVCERQSA